MHAEAERLGRKLSLPLLRADLLGAEEGPLAPKRCSVDHKGVAGKAIGLRPSLQEFRDIVILPMSLMDSPVPRAMKGTIAKRQPLPDGVGTVEPFYGTYKPQFFSKIPYPSKIYNDFYIAEMNISL